jgi:hypothetical protein
MDCMHLAQDGKELRALVNMLLKPSGSIKFWEILE